MDIADEITDAMWALLQTAVEGDTTRAYEIFNGVVQKGERWTYSLLCGLSGVVKLCVDQEIGARPDGLFPLIYDVRTGERVNAEDAGPAAAFAVRFVTANVNGDRDLVQALWCGFLAAHPGDEEVQTDAFASVLAVAVAATRWYTAVKGGRS